MAREDQTIMDMAVEELLELMPLVRDELKREFNGKRPFRQEPVSPKEQILDADEMTPEREVVLRQSFGDEPVDAYLAQIENMRRRYQ